MIAETVDVAVIGAGTAGIPAACHAAASGLRTALVERLDRVGGTMWFGTGQISAAGTSLQRERGIRDDPDQHYADVMRISRGTAHPDFVRLAVDLAPETIERLRGGGMDFHPDCPGIVFNHEPYSQPRTYWGMRKALSILDVMVAELAVAQKRDGLTLLLNHALTGLLPDGADGVAGILVQGPDGTIREVRARQVVLTTGGYAGNPQVFGELMSGLPLYGPLYPSASGGGIMAARSLGAQLWRLENFLPSVGGFEEEPGTHRVNWADRPMLTPQIRLPWELLVNLDGHRFMAEDEESIDKREHGLLAQRDLSFFIVFDAAILRQAPALFPQWPGGELERRLGNHPAFLKAESMDALAAMMGVDPAVLSAEVAAYNRAVAEGTDRLERRHMPLPVTEGPFFAIRNHGVSIKSPGGLAIDASLRVLREDGARFRNLYAAGEAIGGGLLSGKAYVGGMSITPALGFGRHLGREILQ